MNASNISYFLEKSKKQLDFAMEIHILSVNLFFEFFYNRNDSIFSGLLRSHSIPWGYRNDKFLDFIDHLSMFPFIFTLLILLDQASKYLAEHFLATEKIHILGDFLVLSFVKNTGVAFSFPIQGIVLKVLTVALIVGISIYYIRAEPYKNLWYNETCVCIHPLMSDFKWIW